MQVNRARAGEDQAASAHGLLPTERRQAVRHQMAFRSGAWFNLGPPRGVLGELQDISPSGFAVKLQHTDVELFEATTTTFVVLILDGMHFSCLSTLSHIVRHHDEDTSLVGFAIEALDEQSTRLLAGILATFNAR